jgi:hypothetical protein
MLVWAHHRRRRTPDELYRTPEAISKSGDRSREAVAARRARPVGSQTAIEDMEKPW